MKRRVFICAAVSFTATALAIRPAAAEVKGMMTIYKDPNCGCCHLWSEAMKKAGYTTVINDKADLSEIKLRFGVPKAVQGCHTAVIGKYFIEGHVPLAAVEELLMDPHDIAGYAVPGMPSGSLGMGEDPNASYDVYRVGKDGAIDVVLEVKPQT
ncbi:MAG: metal-binding protein [Rhizobium sp.]|nr:metal-binding protein [Rhizobium sp.]